MFDFGGTLDFPRHWLDRFLTHYTAAGICISRKQLAPAFDVATRRAYAAHPVLTSYRLAELVNYLLNLQFAHLTELTTSSRSCLSDDAFLKEEALPDVGKAIRDSFVAESCRGFEITRPLLAGLADRFKIGVVSNFYGNLATVLAEAGLAGWVRVVADSSQMGLWKPDPRIFSAAIAQLGVEPHETIMVGDSLDKDCTPAHALGMKTVWLRHADSIGQRINRQAVDFTIERLEELNEIEWLKY